MIISMMILTRTVNNARMIESVTRQAAKSEGGMYKPGPAERGVVLAIGQRSKWCCKQSPMPPLLQKLAEVRRGFLICDLGYFLN